MQRNWIIGGGLALGLAVLGAGYAVASNHGHTGHGTASAMDHGSHGAAGPSTQAFVAANDRMHADMAIEYTGDADVDFLRGMIPHHQGAVEMAEIVLEFGTDPEVRALAEAIIAAQNEEIAFMRGWLAARGK